jgi:hypothetical protein
MNIVVKEWTEDAAPPPVAYTEGLDAKPGDTIVLANLGKLDSPVIQCIEGKAAVTMTPGDYLVKVAGFINAPEATVLVISILP